MLRERLNCTGGKVGIFSAAPLSLPSQELNINHLRRRKVFLIKLQRCFNVRVSVSDGYQLSENASETQIDTTMTFTVPIVSIEQNKEFHESRVHCTLAGIKSLLKIGEGGSLTREGGGVRNPWNPPLATPLWTRIYFFFDSQIFYEVLDIFPRLSYRLTFIMLDVGMVDNFSIPWSKTCTFPLPGFSQSHVITFFRIITSLCLFSFQGQNNFISLKDIHFQHLASLLPNLRGWNWRS